MPCPRGGACRPWPSFGLHAPSSEFRLQSPTLRVSSSPLGQWSFKLGAPSPELCDWSPELGAASSEFRHPSSELGVLSPQLRVASNRLGRSVFCWDQFESSRRHPDRLSHRMAFAPVLFAQDRQRLVFKCRWNGFRSDRDVCFPLRLMLSSLRLASIRDRLHVELS